MAYLIVIYVICAAYMILNFKHDVHMLQQNSYRLPRYWRYLSKNDIGSAWRLTDVAMIFIVCSRLLEERLALFMVAIMALYKFVAILKKKHKKALVFTKRVWRIYSLTAAIGAALFLWAVFVLGFKPEAWSFYPGPILTVSILLLMTIFSWFITCVAVVILMPVEKIINRKYWNEASKILKGMPDLKVIGITGSYGKTSTKHFLERILSEKYDVLMTPGSFNTTMGVIRTVREYLKPYNNVFICEMGAKQKGDIKEICDLVHPQIGIVTAVGPMHLETFKTIENVQSTKFELIDSLPDDGLAVINDDFEYCSKRNIKNVPDIRYIVEKPEDPDSSGKNLFIARNIRYTTSGTTFEIYGDKGFEIELTTRLVGECNVSNLVAAVIVAYKMGLTDNEIKRGVSSITPVEHRLSMTQTPGGVTILDDAFNSNPHGSKMALDVLSQFKEGRRIVITPGMVELGSRQHELNSKLGEHMAECCDIAIVVGHYNRQSITEGLRKAEFNGELYEVDTFDKAQEIIRPMMRKGDVILYENDLPDSFK